MFQKFWLTPLIAAMSFGSVAVMAQRLQPQPAGNLPPAVFQQVIQSRSTSGLTARLFHTTDHQYLVVSRNGQVVKSFRLDVPMTATQVQGEWTRTEPPPPPPGGNGAVTLSNTYFTPNEVIVVTTTFYYLDHQLVDVEVEVKHLPKPDKEMPK